MDIVMVLLACNIWQSVCQTEQPLANRTILYQMVALYDYNAQGPEDLEFSEGDTIDILSEGESFQAFQTLHNSFVTSILNHVMRHSIT